MADAKNNYIFFHFLGLARSSRWVWNEVHKRSLWFVKGPQSLVGLVMTGQTPIHKENKIDLFPEDIVPVDSSNILLKIGKPASGLPEGQPGSSPPRNLWDQRIPYFLYKLLNSFPLFSKLSIYIKFQIVFPFCDVKNVNFLGNWLRKHGRKYILLLVPRNQNPNQGAKS